MSHIHVLINETGTDFVRDAKTGNVVHVIQSGSPTKAPPGVGKAYWTECVRTDDTSSVRSFDKKCHVRAEPVFSMQGGRVYATFPIKAK